MKVFINASLAKKLIGSFGAVTLILIAIVVLNSNQIQDSASISDRITEVRVPTAMASLQMLNGTNHALAALRGWMLLGKDGFKVTRADAWSEEIWPAFKTLKEASKNWTNPTNVKRLQEIEGILDEFERYQIEIEDIAQTEDNVPSVKMLIREAAPQAAIIVSNITKMIDLEAKLPANQERKALLGMMADVRGTMGLSLANIRAFLLTGDEKFRGKFETLWAKNDRRFADLKNNAGLLSDNQLSAFEALSKARAIFAPIPPGMLDMRAGRDWNTANHWLATKAAPLGGRLSEILKEMAVDQKGLLTTDSVLVQEKNTSILLFGWVMLAVGVTLAGLFAWLVTRYLVSQINRVVVIAHRIAGGDLSNIIDVNSQDETGQLLGTMQAMQTKLSDVIEKDIQTIVDSAREGDLSQRVELEGKEGFYAKLSTGVNDLVDVSDKVVNDTVRVFGAMAHGQLNETIDADYKGSFNELKRDANATVEKISNVIEKDIQEIIDNAVAGDLSRRIDLQGKSGFFKSLSQGVNDLVSAADDAIKGVNDLMLQADDAIQDTQELVQLAVNGDLSQRLQIDGKSDLAKKLGQPVNQLIDVCDRLITDTLQVVSAMAKGDLTRTIETDYSGSFRRLKDDINETVSQLTNVVTEIKSSASLVKSGSEEIANGNTDLSQRTEEQAASLEETSSAMEEMTSTIQQNASNAKAADSLAQGARDSAEVGGQVVGNAVTAMAAINESSKKISDIISVIDEIAFQTNLLALNASVEAARAGDQGRGFAVVADEVRNLAGRSATAAKEIKELIVDSGAKVEEGSRLVNQSGETLEEIVTSVKKVTDIISEISSASDEQASGIEEVNKSVIQMDEMTQQNAALVEEAASASQALGEQSVALDNLISFFKVDTSASGRPQQTVNNVVAPRGGGSAALALVAHEQPVLSEPEDDSEWSQF